MALPKLSHLKPQPIQTLQVLPPFLFRAELTAQLYTQPVGSLFPHWHWIICVVRNTGLIDSGPFQTLITRVYTGTPSLPGPAIATSVAMDVPAGSQRAIIWAEYLLAPLKVGAYADFTHVVPEYNETNNSDTLTVYP